MKMREEGRERGKRRSPLPICYRILCAPFMKEGAIRNKAEQRCLPLLAQITCGTMVIRLACMMYTSST